MFEFESDIVETLLHESKDFERLYHKHDRLKRRVEEVHSGTEPMDDLSLESLKKEKLFLKDKMAVIMDEYRQVHRL